MARPLGVRMSVPMITRTLEPVSVARMILGDCSFQLVQNMRLKDRGTISGVKRCKVLALRSKMIVYEQPN